MVMAYLFLKAQGLAGVEVSDISIDANKKVNVESFFCSSRLICTIG